MARPRRRHRREPRHPRRDLRVLAREGRQLPPVHRSARRQLGRAPGSPGGGVPHLPEAHLPGLVRVRHDALRRRALPAPRAPPREGAGHGAPRAREFAAAPRSRRPDAARPVGQLLPPPRLLPERLPVRRLLLGAAHLPVHHAHVLPDDPARGEAAARRDAPAGARGPAGSRRAHAARARRPAQPLSDRRGH